MRLYKLFVRGSYSRSESVNVDFTGNLLAISLETKPCYHCMLNEVL